jgi:hypothetical protein
MKVSKTTSAFFLVVSIFLGVPLTAIAVTHNPVPQWVLSSGTSIGPFEHEKRFVAGTAVLPPEWVGVIYVYVNGERVLEPVTGKTHLSLASNAGNVSSSTITFRFPLGRMEYGKHEVAIEFWGGESCAIRTLLNERYGSRFTPTCAITADNTAFRVRYPGQDTEILPNFATDTPREHKDEAAKEVIFTPTSALFFGYDIKKHAVDRSVKIKNPGDTPIPVTLKTSDKRFTCISECSLTLMPGEERSSLLRFTPSGDGPVFGTLEGGGARLELFGW